MKDSPLEKDDNKNLYLTASTLDRDSGNLNNSQKSRESSGRKVIMTGGTRGDSFL